MFFGEKFKQLRLDKAKKGLRNFAQEVGMTPSELSRMERGLAPPPEDPKWIWKMIYALCIQSNLHEQEVLMKLWEEPFSMQKSKGKGVVSPFVHKSDGTPLTEKEYLSLNDYINKYYEDNDNKAEEYNKKHGTKRENL